MTAVAELVAEACRAVLGPAVPVRVSESGKAQAWPELLVVPWSEERAGEVGRVGVAAVWLDGQPIDYAGLQLGLQTVLNRAGHPCVITSEPVRKMGRLRVKSWFVVLWDDDVVQERPAI